MTPLKLMGTAMVVAGMLHLGAEGARAQQQVPSAPVAPTFKSSVELVRISATVRDKKGRFVRDMTVRDFEVVDGGVARTISEFRHDDSAVSVALLFDVSGSMEARMGQARETAEHLLSWLNLQGDEAAVYTFDTRLDEVAPFTSGLRRLPPSMEALSPFGATSLHDAVATTARKIAEREGLRRAVVVLTGQG